MFHAEDPYGKRKRLFFCRDLIAASGPRLVLDMGCGTGTQLTEPLAVLFPSVRFIGLDTDEASIRFARGRPALTNLEYGGLDMLSTMGPADLVIASEVVEHVEEPDAFLMCLRDKLSDDGRMLVTLPNGYGPFELATFLETLLTATGLYPGLRRLKRQLFGQPPPPSPMESGSLAVSPHLNFFTFGSVVRLFAAAGLSVLQYKPRTLLCGFFFDKAIARLNLCDWNAAVADALPAQFNSAWMFVLAKAPPISASAFSRGRLSRMRRRLNEVSSRVR